MLIWWTIYRFHNNQKLNIFIIFTYCLASYPTLDPSTTALVSKEGDIGGEVRSTVRIWFSEDPIFHRPTYIHFRNRNGFPSFSFLHLELKEWTSSRSASRLDSCPFISWNSSRTKVLETHRYPHSYCTLKWASQTGVFPVFIDLSTPPRRDGDSDILISSVPLFSEENPWRHLLTGHLIY